MPLWALWLRDFDILNIFYDEFKIEKMAKFETLIVPRGLTLLWPGPPRLPSGRRHVSGDENREDPEQQSRLGCSFHHHSREEHTEGFMTIMA